MKRETGDDLPMETPRASSVPETLEEKPSPLSLVPQALTIQELIAKAEGHGFKVADIVTGAKLYHNQTNIYRLTPEQITDLDRRISARIEKTNAAAARDDKAGASKQAATGSDANARAATAARNIKRA
jgi:hypothetical protein